MANKDSAASTSMAISDFGTISVDPDVLRETAEAAYRQIANYRQGLEAVSKLVLSSEDFWKGEAGDTYRQVFKVEYAKALEALNDYEMYPVRLLEYAGIYSQVIAEGMGYAESVSEFTMA